MVEFAQNQACTLYNEPCRNILALQTGNGPVIEVWCCRLQKCRLLLSLVTGRIHVEQSASRGSRTKLSKSPRKRNFSDVTSFSDKLRESPRTRLTETGFAREKVSEASEKIPLGQRLSEHSFRVGMALAFQWNYKKLSFCIRIKNAIGAQRIKIFS